MSAFFLTELVWKCRGGRENIFFHQQSKAMLLLALSMFTTQFSFLTSGSIRGR